MLTARNEAACGLTNKPKEVIVDVDAKNAAKHWAPVEYVEDMYKFYKFVENEKCPHDCTDFQHENNTNMRAMAGVHSKSEWTVFLVRFIKVAIPDEQVVKPNPSQL